MTPSVALPGAVLRVMRGAAGRRVLQVALWVGGLIVLGFLCGEQAHAADGTSRETTVPAAVTTSSEAVQFVRPATKSAEERAEPAGGVFVSAAAAAAAPAPAPAPVSAPPVAAAHDTATALTGNLAGPKGTLAGPRGVGAAPEGEVTAPEGAVTAPKGMVIPDPSSAVTDPSSTVTAVTSTVGRVVLPVEGRVELPVTEQVVKPVGDLVETVTGVLAGGASKFPPLPGMPSLPVPPEVPELPELPGLPGLPGVPADLLPVGTAPQQPHPGGSVPGQQETTEHGDASGARPAARAGVGYGPRFVDDYQPVAGPPRHSQGAEAAQTPAHHTPDGPAGALGRHSAVGNGGSRHGEPHAVTLDHRAPMSLVPGVTVAVAADGTRDRHRDIPEFPG